MIIGTAGGIGYVLNQELIQFFTALHSIINNIMKMQERRQYLADQYRKGQHQNYFKKVRMVLLAQQHRNITKSLFNSNSQQEILQSIFAWRRDRCMINFQMVNQYILQYHQGLTKQFKIEVAAVVLDDFRTNGYAIASLAHILVNNQDLFGLEKIDKLSEKVREIIKENIQLHTGKFFNAKAITFLIFGILNSVDRELWSQFNFLTNYYQLFADNIGYYDSALLVLLQTASHYPHLLPSQEFIRCLLGEQLPYSQLDIQFLLTLCQFIENYCCSRLSRDLYLQLSKWIQRRLKEKKFPQGLKQNLIKIITINLSSNQVAQVINSHDADLKVFLEISNIARFGSPLHKDEAINCLAQLIRCSTPQTINYLVQFYPILEILVYSLDLPLTKDLVSKVLDCLAKILEMKNRQYIKMAASYGILAQITRLSSSQYVEVGTLADTILAIYHDC